jgi:nitrogen fixation NifU-like protein
MFDDLNELYQEVILHHSNSPSNFRKLDDANRSAEGNNPVCGDRFTIFIKLENDTISDIGFQGSGCAISKAAASLMTETLKGKSVGEAEKFFQQYQEMIKTGIAEKIESTKLGVFAGVHKFPMRVKCAVLSWHAMMAALKGDQKIVSTEAKSNMRA